MTAITVWARMAALFVVFVIFLIFLHLARSSYQEMEERHAFIRKNYSLIKQTLIQPCDRKVINSKEFFFNYKTLNNKWPKLGSKHHISNILSKESLPTMWHEP